MSMTDPVADMLTRIRNGLSAGHETVKMYSSKLKKAVAKVLHAEGYIEEYHVSGDPKKPELSIKLKYYGEDEKPVISKLVRVSKPGCRIYASVEDLSKNKVLGGLGIRIVSTSKGVVTDREAIKLNASGEVICSVE